jgi:hypothetical protein
MNECGNAGNVQNKGLSGYLAVPFFFCSLCHSPDKGFTFFILMPTFTFMRNRSVLILLVLSIFSCSKEDDTTAEQPITLPLALTTYTWNIYRQTLSFEDGSSTDLTNITFKPCELDDLLTFGKDGFFRKSEGGLVCTPPGGSVFNNLNGAPFTVQDSTLTIIAGFNIQVYKVASWSRTKMTWKQSQTNYLGEKVTYVYDLMAR